MIVRLLRAGALALGVAYAVLGLWGMRAGLAVKRGVHSAYGASSVEALGLLDRARVGYDAPEIAWLAGEVALGVADRASDAAAGLAALDTAASRYLEMTLRSGGSAYGLVGLAGVEDRLEHAELTSRTIDLSTLDSGPWAQIGEHGRLAIGLLRLAIEREPTLVPAHDALITAFLRHGLIDDAARAARAAAHVAPALEYHPDLDPASLPPEVVRAFADGAHEALDRTPLAERERKLFYLGLLDERVGALDRAVDDLEAAHADPAAGSVERAETAYHLGRILARLGRVDEAQAAWRDGENSPIFAAAIAEERARLDEAGGRIEAALAEIGRARSFEPRRLDLILAEARLLTSSGNRAAAIERLHWAVTIERTSRPAHAALVRALIDDGDLASARRTLAEFESALGEADDTRELEEMLRTEP